MCGAKRVKIVRQEMKIETRAQPDSFEIRVAADLIAAARLG